MKKNLMIINIVFSCLTVLVILFGSLMYWYGDLQNGTKNIVLPFEVLLAIFGLGSYLGVLIIGAFMINMWRGNGLVKPLIKVDAILNVAFGSIFILGTVICHGLGNSSAIFAMTMGVCSITLLIFSVIAYKLGTNCCANDI